MSEVTESEMDRSDVANLNDIEPEMRYVTIVIIELAVYLLNYSICSEGVS
jgi:hypothetical protein